MDEFILKKVGRSLKNRPKYKTDKIKYAKKIKSDKELKKKLDRYSALSTIGMMIIWATYIFFLILYPLNAIGEEASTRNIILVTLFIIHFLSSMGPAWYIAASIEKTIFNLNNPHLKKDLTENYHMGMYDSKQMYSVPNLNFNTVNFEKILVKYTAFVYFITFILFLLIDRILT